METIPLPQAETAPSSLAPSQASLTPMMRQYSEIKARNPGALLLYRMGDFYELFNDDAIVASKLLGLTLTSRNHGGADKTPLAGFPHHAIERYMPKLIGAGLKVAICEQVEDPADAKGVVRREVVEVVTRGTAINDNYLDAKTNNFLAALAPGAGGPDGLAYLDLSTGQFVAMEGREDQVLAEIQRLAAPEVLFPEGPEWPSGLRDLAERERTLITVLPKGYFHEAEGRAELLRQFKVHSLEAFDCGQLTSGVRAAAAALAYAREHKKTELGHLVRLELRRFDRHMALDGATIRNLELVRPLHADDEGGTLFHLLDKTVTAMGGRLLKFWLTHPLLDLEAIRARQAAVAELLARPEALESLRARLRQVNDIERIVAKAGAARVHARDLVGLGSSLVEAAEAAAALEGFASTLVAEARSTLEPYRDFGSELLSKLAERPPLTVREGGMIRPGAFPELDALVEGVREGREWLNNLQAREREATGIASLKVGYNKVFGYYLEVSKANEDKVPAHYLRKQSLVNGERYITPEMKEWENRLLNAEGEINALEYRLFCGLRERVNARAAGLLDAARRLAALDVLACLAVAAREYRFTRPELAEDGHLTIINGRHPVVEEMTPPGEYIPNDLELDAGGRQILLVTGPNMAGKSTYLRQAGLIALLAQVGAYVPADSARIGLVDRIFTRVGASDRLSKGQSTFMVEMIETANILRHATPRSLILLDEIGRGTSTYDGLSLAWAIVESLHQDPAIAARTLFATHYHELTALAGELPRVHNVQVTVREADGMVIFLRKVVEGGCDSSYGIQVARMAGVPEPVIRRAWEILGQLEARGGKPGTPTPRPGARGRAPKDLAQVDLFAPAPAPAPAPPPADPRHQELYRSVLALDLNSMSPLELMLQVAELRKRYG